MVDPEQARVADSGLKAMIPVGRPFLDYVISGLADAGYHEVCLVIGPEHHSVREHYSGRATRVRISFAIQERPRGTADAVLAAERFTAGEPFVVLNSDNYYPTRLLDALRRLGEPGLPAFGRAALVRDGAIPAERIASYALLDIANDGYLRRIIEKPDEATVRALGEDSWVSMNCWRFSAAIFGACRAIAPSPRGELELPLAVQYAIEVLSERFRTLPVHAQVLDLSNRGDIAGVTERLSGIDARP